MVENPLNGKRSEDAVERLNAIHGHYKIANADHVYTLCVFVCEPVRWTERYAWRPLSPAEKDALVVYWRHMGHRMGIQDIPKDLEGFFQYMSEYEDKYMTYSKHSENVAKATVDLFVSKIPTFLVPVARALLATLLDDHVLDAMGLHRPPKALRKVMYGVMRARALFVRHLMLPRWKIKYHTPKHKDISGRYMPHYHNYGLIYPNGYTLEELGPLKFMQE
jgi:uncharacterized protein (DUF2236 family)